MRLKQLLCAGIASLALITSAAAESPDELAPGAARVMTFVTECNVNYGPVTGYLSAILLSANQDVAWAANRNAYSEFNRRLSKYSSKKLLCEALGNFYKSVAEIGKTIHPNAVVNREIKKFSCKEISDEECRSLHVAEVLWHADNCDSNDIPPATLTFAQQYAANHPSQIKEAMKGQETVLGFVVADLRKAGVADTMKFICQRESKWIGGKLWD